MVQSWDAIVIGSGMGGMSAAGFLAKAAGMKVLVLEKHSERGGQTHVFRRDGASWDVGLHYLGELQPGTFVRSLFDFLSGGALGWNRMPDDFERFFYPGFAFAVPSDPRRYQARLIERFPDEADAIRRYFRDLRAVARWHILGIQQQMAPAPLAFLLAQVAAFRRRTRHPDDRRIPRASFPLARAQSPARHPMGRLRLAAKTERLRSSRPRRRQLPERRLVSRRRRRAHRPHDRAGNRGGGRLDPVCQEATAILVENGRAVGVKAIDRRSGEPIAVAYRAPVVISDVGAPLTYERLLPTDGEIGRRTAKQRAAVAALKGGLSAVNLYLRLKAPVSTLGVEGENYWINATLDHDDVDEHAAATLAGDPRHVYLSFPSAKSGDDRFHTAEIIAFVRPEAFDAWRGTATWRPRARLRRTQASASPRGCCALADRAVPGLSALVAYSELSTPLTIEHFTSHPARPVLRPAGNAAALPLLAARRAHADPRPLSCAAPMRRASASPAP